MGDRQIVRHGRGFWSTGPDGELGPRDTGDCGRGLARQRGFTKAEIDNAPEAETVVGDPLVGKTSFDAPTLTVVEAPARLERREVTSMAWHLRELLENPANRHFAELVVRHGDDVFVDQRAPWLVHDLGLYWPYLVPPGVDRAGRRQLRLLSKGRDIVLTRRGKPSRKFVALDLRRVWELADAFAQENAEVMESWRKFGAEHWVRLGRRGAVGSTR
jgi:hypothetical protein